MRSRKIGNVSRGILLWLAPVVLFPLSTAKLAVSGAFGDGLHTNIGINIVPFAILALVSAANSIIDCFFKCPGIILVHQVVAQLVLLLYFLSRDEAFVVPHAGKPATSAGRSAEPKLPHAWPSAHIPRPAVSQFPGMASFRSSDNLPRNPPSAFMAKSPTISVVLPCLNETYVRETVQSFCERTPREALQEVLIVDDGSSPPISQKLDGLRDCPYRIIRHEKPWGLMIAKQTGGDAAKGKHIGFFDCHVAPERGWHKEIIELLEAKPRRLVVPMIGDLNIDTYDLQKENVWKTKCYIDFNADFWWYEDETIFMPAISGGLVATSREWWHDSGGYDSGMRGWGGENSDQSLRAWLCGGDVVRATSSHIAHMWRVTTDARTLSRYSWAGKQTDNLARVAAAWFDEFSGMFHNGVSPTINVSETLDRKHRLGCKPFVYYLHRFRKIYRDAAVIPPSVFRIKARGTDRCIVKSGMDSYRVAHCQMGTWFQLANLLPDGFPTEGAFDGDVPHAADAPRSTPVVCGSHKAASCSECPQGHGEGWCNGDCKWVFGSCALKETMPHPPQSTSTKRKCCSGIREYKSMYCFDAMKPSGPISYQCDVGGGNNNQQYIFHSDGRIRHSSGSCLATVGDSLAPADCSLPAATRWDRAEEYEPDVFRRYAAAVKRYGLTEDLPDH